MVPAFNKPHNQPTNDSKHNDDMEMLVEHLQFAAESAKTDSKSAETDNESVKTAEESPHRRKGRRIEQNDRMQLIIRCISPTCSLLDLFWPKWDQSLSKYVRRHPHKVLTCTPSMSETW